MKSTCSSFHVTLGGIFLEGFLSKNFGKGGKYYYQVVGGIHNSPRIT